MRLTAGKRNLSVEMKFYSFISTGAVQMPLARTHHSLSAHTPRNRHMLMCAANSTGGQGAKGQSWNTGGSVSRLQTIEFTIMPDGTVEERVIGVAGASCVQVSSKNCTLQSGQ